MKCQREDLSYLGKSAALEKGLLLLHWLLLQKSLEIKPYRPNSKIKGQYKEFGLTLPFIFKHP